MIDKVTSLADAVKDVSDGATIFIGGFSSAGTPHNLIETVSRMDLKGLTLVANAPAQLLNWKEPRSVLKVICSFALYPFSAWRLGPLTEAMRDGKVAFEVMPQGNLIERIRAGGHGIPAFYTPVGVGTLLGQGRETRVFGGRECLLETALTADFALIKGHRADRLGNLVYRMAQRNFNPLMAMAAAVTVAEVDELVDVGKMEPEEIITPGIFVKRVVPVAAKIIKHR